MLQEYKKLLRLEIDINAELIELLEECFDEIFGEDKFKAKSDLDDMLNNFEDWGCLQKLQYFRNTIKQANERHTKWMADQEAKKLEE